MEERILMRKAVRKDGNKAGFGVLIYVILTYVIMYLLPYLLYRIFPNADLMMELVGAAHIIAVVAGVSFLLLYYRKQGVHKQIFQKEKKMTPTILLAATCVFMCAKSAGGFSATILEIGLKLFGYSSSEALEQVVGIGQGSVTLFLYAGILGPIAEELVYRGFLMRHLQKYGKMVALVGSALVFGLMHCNLSQSIYAVLVGLVFGYVAMEYSVIWSIVLHIINNLVFGDLFLRAISGCSQMVQTLITAAIMYGFVIAGIVILICKGKALTVWRKENAWTKPNMRWVITSIGMLLFAVGTIIFTIRSITPV